MNLFTYIIRLTFVKLISVLYKKVIFQRKTGIVRNIIRESLSGNAAFALLVYSLLHSFPIKTFADLFVTILLFIAIIAVVIWLFLIIYVYFVNYSEVTG